MLKSIWSAARALEDAGKIVLSAEPVRVRLLDMTTLVE